MKVSWSKMTKRNNKQRAARNEFTRVRNSLVFDPPPIWFVPEVKTGEGVKTAINEKETYKEIESYFDLSNKPLGKFKVKIRVLRDPSPEDWLQWLREVDELYDSKHDLSPKAKALIVPQFLTENAKAVWQKNYLDACTHIDSTFKAPEDATNAELKEHDLLCNDKIYEETINACTKEFLHKDQPAISQKNYMQKNLSLTGFAIRDFVTRLKTLNEYLPYFPPRFPGGPKVQKLNEDELVSIIVGVMTNDIRALMMQSTNDPLAMPFDQLIDTIERLQRSVQYQNNTANFVKFREQIERDKKQKVSDFGNGNRKPKNNNKHKKQKKFCTHCKMNNHQTSDCWFVNKKKATNNGYADNGNGNGKRNFNTANKKETTFNVAQMSALLAHMPSFQEAKGEAPRKKRRIIMDSSDEEVEVDETPNAYFANLKIGDDDEDEPRSSTKGK